MPHSGSFLKDEKLLDVLLSIDGAVAVHIGEDAVIQYATDRMIALWGKGRSVMGKTLEEALPELKGQPFIDLFKRVWNEGITVADTDTPADLLVDGKLQTFYFDFEYRPLKDEAGKTYCILHTATDVTERYLSKEREKAFADELAKVNEHLAASNKQLNETNAELYKSNQSIAQLYKELAASNKWFRQMVKLAPVGICMINAEDLMVLVANDAYLKLVGKDRLQVEERKIWDAVPEAAELYAPIMDTVIVTGKPFVAKEEEVRLIRHGVSETVFIDFVYEPITVDGKVTTLMALAIDVTDKVIARHRIEEVEERIRLAVEAAEIGTFDVDLVKKTIVASESVNTLFGIAHEVSWEKLINFVHPDDRHERDVAYVEALKTGKLFYEVRVIHPDKSVHWIRAQGKIYFNNKREAVRLLGTLLDITQVKYLEQQKEDFISIAGHELRTPITSLKASLQLMERLKNNTSSPLLPKLIDQSIKSTEKVSFLVEELLNVSRSRETQLQLNKTTFKVADLMEACCSHIRVAGKYTLTIQGDKQSEIYADEHAIDQVVTNMVNNAVKYAPESLEIFLNIEKLKDGVKISIRDTGPGIPSEKLPFLFDRYYQAEHKGFNNAGLGLGLYISSEIIKRHDGQIGVNSKLGSGTTFWFILPS